MNQGTKHEIQPEFDALITIDFNEMPDLLVGARTEWNLTAAGGVCRTIAQTSGAFSAFRGMLEELGEIPAWKFLADVAVHSGFDVYNSDSMFEVYRGHTWPAMAQPGILEEIWAVAADGNVSDQVVGSEARRILGLVVDVPF